MGWIRLDDAFLDHPKFLEVGPLAGYLMIASIAWANRNLTDGFIPSAQVARLANYEGLARLTWACEIGGGGEDICAANLAQELVEAGLWEPLNEGFQIHDYLDFQSSAARIRAGRAKNAARQERHRERNAVTNGPVTPPKEVRSKKEEVRSKKQEEKKEEKENVADRDAAPLSHLLADLIVQNGSRRPRIGQRWTEAERLLLDRDKRDRNEAEQLIRWCQGDSFWRSNILSLPKFREKYDTLRLQRQAGEGKGRFERAAEPGKYKGRARVMGAEE